MIYTQNQIEKVREHLKNRIPKYISGVLGQDINKELFQQLTNYQGNKNNIINEKNKRFWCSALVAFVYVKFGFLKQDTPWNLITAKMFGTEKQDNNLLEFSNCSLDN